MKSWPTFGNIWSKLAVFGQHVVENIVNISKSANRVFTCTVFILKNRLRCSLPRASPPTLVTSGLHLTITISGFLFHSPNFEITRLVCRANRSTSWILILTEKKISMSSRVLTNRENGMFRLYIPMIRFPFQFGRRTPMSSFSAELQQSGRPSIQRRHRHLRRRANLVTRRPRATLGGGPADADVESNSALWTFCFRKFKQVPSFCLLWSVPSFSTPLA